MLRKAVGATGWSVGVSTCLSGSILSGLLVKFTILTSTLHFFKVNIVLLPLKYPLTLFGDPCKSILYIGSDVGVHIRLLHACPQGTPMAIMCLDSIVETLVRAGQY